MTDTNPENQQQNNPEGNSLNDLPPETKAFIQQNLHKAEKFLNNPLVAGFFGATGLDLSELKKITGNSGDGLISITKTQKTPNGVTNNEVVFTNSQKTEFVRTNNPSATPLTSGTSTSSGITSASGIIPSAHSTNIPPIPAKIAPTTFSNKQDTRGIIGILAIIGLIGWLLYQFTDIM